MVRKGGFKHPSQKVQLYVYDTCIQRYRDCHQWMAFIDADEFIVIKDKRMPELTRLLWEYEGYGGLVINWQVGTLSLKRTGNRLALGDQTS